MPFQFATLSRAEQYPQQKPTMGAAARGETQLLDGLQGQLYQVGERCKTDAGELYAWQSSGGPGERAVGICRVWGEKEVASKKADETEFLLWKRSLKKDCVEYGTEGFQRYQGAWSSRELVEAIKEVDQVQEFIVSQDPAQGLWQGVREWKKASLFILMGMWSRWSLPQREHT